MGNLYSFLNPVSFKEEKEIVISERFVQRDDKGEIIKGKDGNPLIQKFKVRSLTQDENEAIVNECRRSVKVNGVVQSMIDTGALGRHTVVEGTVEPNFRDTKLCEAFGTLDPYQVPAKMLLPGEYQKLLNAIQELSGFDIDVVEEAKN